MGELYEAVDRTRANLGQVDLLEEVEGQEVAGLRHLTVDGADTDILELDAGVAVILDDEGDEGLETGDRLLRGGDGQAGGDLEGKGYCGSQKENIEKLVQTSGVPGLRSGSCSACRT